MTQDNIWKERFEGDSAHEPVPHHCDDSEFEKLAADITEELIQAGYYTRDEHGRVVVKNPIPLVITRSVFQMK